MLETKDKAVDHRVERLIPLVDVKKVLALSWPMVTGLARDGTLPAYSVNGRAVSRSQVTEHTRGLRVPESALRAYIDSIRVRWKGQHSMDSNNSVGVRDNFLEHSIMAQAARNYREVGFNPILLSYKSKTPK